MKKPLYSLKSHIVIIFLLIILLNNYINANETKSIINLNNITYNNVTNNIKLSNNNNNMSINMSRIDKKKSFAYVTIFYDYGQDSDEMLLSIRVLMKSIKDQSDKINDYKCIVILPIDKAKSSTLEVLQKDGILIHYTSIKNVFLYTSIMDNKSQLNHFKNKLILWDDDYFQNHYLSLIYLDPENIVLKNMQEIFYCKDLCCIDNGQSVVYSNGLMVINPRSKEARNIVSEAIQSFTKTGYNYNYKGISQGFIPKLFETFEKSPIYFPNENNSINLNQSNYLLFNNNTNKDSITYRLPYYYSINHMVYYERLNWDLYRCNNPSLLHPNTIPGPVLSYKYRGKTIKPWNWVPYVYFNIFWYWQEIRMNLPDEKEKANNLILYTFLKLSFFCLLFWFIFLLIYIIGIFDKLKKDNIYINLNTINDKVSLQRNNSSGVTKLNVSNINSSFYVTPRTSPSNIQRRGRSNVEKLEEGIQSIDTQPTIGLELCMGNTKRNGKNEKIRLFTWIISVLLVVLIFISSTLSIPTITPPISAARLWFYAQILQFVSLAAVIRILKLLFQGQPGGKLKIKSYYANRLWYGGKYWFLHFFSLFLLQCIFLKATNERYYYNPVQKPVLLISLLGSIFSLQAKIIYKCMTQSIDVDRINNN